MFLWAVQNLLMLFMIRWLPSSLWLSSIFCSCLVCRLFLVPFFFSLCIPLLARGWLWLAVFSRRCAVTGYPHAIFKQLTIQVLHSVYCRLGHFSSFSRLFCILLFPSKTFHSFCLVLSEILAAELSFDSCITSESAWIIPDDLPMLLSFNYTSSSVSSTPEPTFPTGCAPSCCQIPCLLIVISHDSMSKVLLKSKRHDSYCFSSVILTCYADMKRRIICHNLSITKSVGCFFLQFPFSLSVSFGRFSSMGHYLSGL